MLRRLRGLWAFGAMLALAGASSALDGDEPWAVARIGEYHVLEGDVHAHSILAGALPTPWDLALLARHERLDFLAVVEHNSLFGAEWTRDVGRSWAPEVMIIPSTEITTRRYHALAIGLREPLDPTRPLHELADETHRQGGVLVAAHPVRHFWEVLLPVAAAGKLDGVEVMHPIRRGSRPWNRWRPDDLPDFWAEASRQAGRPLAALGGSDFHGLSLLGVCRSVVLAKERSVAGVLEAIRAGRAVTQGPNGRLEGNPQWVKLLQDARYEVRRSRHGYGEATPLAQGLAGAALLVLLCWLWTRRTAPLGEP